MQTTQPVAACVPTRAKYPSTTGRYRLVPKLARLCFLFPVLTLPVWCGCSRSDAPASNTSDAPPETTGTVNNTGISAQAEIDTRLRRARRSLLRARLSDTERELRGILELEPQNASALRMLTTLLDTQGRRWESIPYTFCLLQSGQFALQDLVLLATPSEPFEDIELIQAAVAATPDDPSAAIGLVSRYLRDNRDGEVLRLLREIVAHNPQHLEAQARLGRLLLDMGLPNDFVQWESSLPADADAHPDIWFARGFWAERHDQWSAAARCYWESLRRAPNHRPAVYQLGMVLNKQGETEVADLLMRRSQQLSALEIGVFPLFAQGPDVTVMKEAARITESLGRLWEAWGWHVAILSVAPADPESLAARDRLRKTLDQTDPPQTLADHHAALQLNLSDRPLPDFSSTRSFFAHSDMPAVSRVHFVDMALEAGIDFRYFESWIHANRELMLLETTGGGVAVLDYDNDGWPDLYFTQCCPWPVDPDQPDFLDRLFRNLGDGTFQDVTLQAGIRENGYSQGVAAGDFNNDGFTDLYVANVGQNRLYLNNGDGTFTHVPHHDDTRLIWTTSAMIADVNGDGLPDIFDVNYVTGDDVYTRHCIIDGQLRSCGPLQFDGEVDFLYLNLGNGQWRDVSVEAGVHARAGRGLGIVAADFEHTGRVSLYVTNDVMGNHFLVNQADTDTFVPQFVDEGTLRGIAFDSTGSPQASMGIACDDINGDGLLDLLVANYYNDANTLYVQQPGGFFSDETREFGMRDPSFLLLAFGCQFLDANQDGFPDLIVANGHVDDFTYRGEPWHMRPQFFLNAHGKVLVELLTDDAGPYFGATYLGRGAATIDWNRDGREDVAVSNIGAPASLATNLTEANHHWLAVRLVGVQSARDAYGSRVVVEWGENRTERQLVAGSGFHAANQRQLLFGLGPAPQIDRVTVTWPSGQVQSFEQLTVDREWLLIEGDPGVFQVPIER